MEAFCSAADCNSVGARIRAFREEQGLDIDKVADITRLDPGFLRKLENGEIYPSIGPLQKVARALGVRLGTFIDDQQNEDPVICHTDASAKDTLVGRNECEIGDTATPAYIYQALGKGKSDRNMEPFHVEIFPAADAVRKLSSHQGEEFIYILSGRLRIIYGKNEYMLNPGESIYYNSIVPHCLSAAGGTPCRLLAVTYNP